MAQTLPTYTDDNYIPPVLDARKASRPPSAMITIMTRLRAALIALLPLLVLACLPAATACNAYGPRGPAAVRIDPAFSAEQKQAVYEAVDAWDIEAGLAVAISTWDDESAIKIERNDSILSAGQLGRTHTGETHADDVIYLASEGHLPTGELVGAFDFGTSAAHELGHLFGLSGSGPDHGCDGHGHSSDPRDLMYAHGTPDGARHAITERDVERVRAAVETAW